MAFDTLVGEGAFTKDLKDQVNANFDLAAEASNVPAISSGTDAPSSTPGKVGDIYVKTDTQKIYFATGTSSDSDWTIVN